jgi:hypothetical protein
MGERLLSSVPEWGVRQAYTAAAAGGTRMVTVTVSATAGKEPSELAPEVVPVIDPDRRL